MCDLNTAEEYSMQYYDFTPMMFFSIVKKILHTQLESLVTSAMDVSKSNDSNDNWKIVKLDFENILTKYQEACNTAVSKIKEPINEFFSIPKNIVLDEDKVFENDISDILFKKQEVEELEQQYLKLKTYSAILEQELEYHEKLQPMVKYNFSEEFFKFEKKLEMDGLTREQCTLDFFNT